MILDASKIAQSVQEKLQTAPVKGAVVLPSSSSSPAKEEKEKAKSIPSNSPMKGKERQRQGMEKEKEKEQKKKKKKEKKEGGILNGTVIKLKVSERYIDLQIKPTIPL